MHAFATGSEAAERSEGLEHLKGAKHRGWAEKLTYSELFLSQASPGFVRAVCILPILPPGGLEKHIHAYPVCEYK